METIVEGWISVLLGLILISGAFLVTRRDLLALVSTYSIQSFLLSAVAISLYFVEKSSVLIYLAILTFASKSVLIPHFIRTIQKKMRIRRDLEFHYLTPISSIFVTLVLTLVAYFSLSKALGPSSGHGGFYLGAVLGVSLALMGMMIIFSRRKVVTKIMGYLMMENGVLLFGMFLTELPFIVEAMIVVDLIILVLIAAMLAVGMDASIEEFQARLNAAHKWFSAEKDGEEK